MTATTILLDGPMGRRFGRKHMVHLDTKTPQEAVRWLLSQFPSARQYLAESSDKGTEFAIWRGNGESYENIGLEHIGEPAGSFIRFTPVVRGAKSSGVLQTVLGIVLIVVGALTSWSGGTALIVAGIGMVAGGVVQMLSPQPKLNKGADSSDNQSSYVFNGPINTSAQGGCVPLAYGRVRVGSAIISAGIEAQDYSAAQSNIGHGTVGGNFKQTPYDPD